MHKLFARLSIQAYVALAFFLLSIVFYILIPYQIEKPKLLFGRAFMDMEPTLFPKIAALGLCAMSALSFFISLSRPEKNPFKGMNLRSFGKIAGLLVILYVYSLIFAPLGFLVAGVLITAALSLYLGNRNPITLALLSFGVPLTVYYVFTRLLLISLPEGILY